MKISTLTHPTYTLWAEEWDKFRAAFNGGMTFVIDYLEKFSVREDDTDFDLRKKISYCPAHAKAAILDVKNSIYQRLVSVTRTNGPLSYQEAIRGQNRGVDLQGRSMDDFIGSVILQELLVMGKVGVYIDKPIVGENETVLEGKDKRPYLYYYTAENIKSWSYDSLQQLSSLLLQDSQEITDEETGLVIGEEIRYRLYHKIEGGVEVTIYNDKDIIVEGPSILDLERVPFVIFEISNSLMVDVADYQVALLNLASSDMRYATSSNFPFYIEQYDAAFNFNMLKGATPADSGETDTAKESKDAEIKVGTSQGRRYPKGLDAPAFINPSSEPLEASMKKQERLIKEIRLIINLSIENLDPSRASQESKQEDNTGLEAGLSYIGMELAYGEREIAEIWAMYEGSAATATIKYPTEYKLVSDADRRKEAEDKEKMIGKIPSHTFKKQMAKDIVKLSLGHKTSPDLLDTINKEIDSAKVIISDPDVIRSDHEAGLVGDELASLLRGYPIGEHTIAQEDHAKRAIRILAAQTSNKDLTNDPNAEVKKKEDEQNVDTNVSGNNNTRNQGKG